MKLIQKEYLWALGLVIAGLLLYLYWGAADASGNHITINNEFNDFSTHGISSGDLNSALAQVLAMDGINCTTSTRKKQMGLGVGHSNGKNGGAVGGCKTFVTNGGTVWMIGGKVAGANGAKPRYNFGLNWTID